jgi:ABC-2 type transport system permease protein
MNQNKHKWFTDLRIVLAVAWKDILEGWKNKVILTSVITSLFLVIFYYYLPDLTDDGLPLMVIFDPNNHITREETSCITDFNYRVEKVQETFYYAIRDMDTPVIGIELEQEPLQYQSDSPLDLEGYYPNWMKPYQKETIKTSAERTLERCWGIPVEIASDGNIVYPIMDNNTYGKIFIASAGLLLQLTVMGLSMAPQLIVEEKETRTLQAIVVSPATLGHFVLGKTLAVLFYTLLTTAIGLLFVGSLIIQWGLALAALAIGMFTVITPGILLGVLIQNKQQISIWMWVIFLPTMLPIFFSIVRELPDPLMKVIDWWPTVALARMLRAGFTLNPPTNTYSIEMIYLVILSIIFFLITLLVIRHQRAKGI